MSLQSMNKDAGISSREVAWLKAANAEINAVCDKVISPLYETGIKLPLDDIEVVARSNNEQFNSLLPVLFETGEPSMPRARLTYFDGNEQSPLAPCHGVEHTGLFDKTSGHAVVFGKGFGLYKSLAVGVASVVAQSYGFVPAHAACCEVADAGILLVGGHNAGKSVSLFHLMDIAEDARIVTDDWVVVDDVGRATGIEKTVSFTPRFCNEFPYLGLERYIDGNMHAGIKKCYIRPDIIYGPHTQLQSTQLDTVVFLEPAHRKDIFGQVAKAELVAAIVDGSTHAPDCDREVVRHRTEQWADILSRCRCFSFDTRHASQPMPSYKDLYARILAGD